MMVQLSFHLQLGNWAGYMPSVTLFVRHPILSKSPVQDGFGYEKNVGSQGTFFFPTGRCIFQGQHVPSGPKFCDQGIGDSISYFNLKHQLYLFDI